MAAPEGADAGNWGLRPRYGEFEIVGAAEGNPKLLGQGSFGKTFEAVRTDSVAGGVITEQVAIKVLNPALLASESKRFQFIQELVALTKFKHPNLIHYIRCGEEGGEVYYAMELCRGGDLLHLVRRFGTLPERVAALAGLQIACGLREVHQRHRLVHRDIKPSNVMIVDEIGEEVGVQRLALHFEEQPNLCRIVDFGLVDFTLNAQDTRSHFVGSPMYASPEQIREQPVDGRSDIYSLGMTLWFLVQGKGPLLNPDGRAIRSVHEVMSRHTAEEEHGGVFPQHLSDAFQQILARMVAKRPEDRFGSAGELQTALREYLASPQTVPKPRFSITRIAAPLRSAFDFRTELPGRMGCKSYLATKKNETEQFRLTVLPAAPQPDLHQQAAALCEQAQLSQLPGLPSALMPVREVFEAGDHAAFSEDCVAEVPLVEVLRVRAKAKRPIAFVEALSILGPIAEGVEFLLQRGRASLSFSSEEIWLEGLSNPAEALVRSLGSGDWLRVRLSMMALPREDDAPTAGPYSSTDNTVSESLVKMEADSHPVATLARLVYRMMSGSDAPPAAQFNPNAYAATLALSDASNDLLRDVLCRRRPRTSATSILAELSKNEGVVWVPRKPGGGGSSVPSASATPVGAGGSATPTGAVASATPTSMAGSATPSSLGGGTADARRTKTLDKTCEVVAPGLVRSPFARREQQVAPEEWVPAGKVTCQVTQKTFRLPRKLAPLTAEVLSPGVVHSPYAAPGETQRVPWEEWVPGGEVVCAESGKRLTLPTDLALPEGILPIGARGLVISPYEPSNPISVPAEQWEPGGPVVCPATGFSFLLPKDLPSLDALVNPHEPGVLTTPYAPAVQWPIPPAEWRAGTEVQCPFSRKPLRLPPEVDRWPVEGTVIDAQKRLIANPCRAESSIEVPRDSWKPGQQIACPATRRPVILPNDLPPLVAEAVEDRPGVVISPYSGEPVAVERTDWLPGARVACPGTGTNFLLPSRLPNWLPCGSIIGLPAGQVCSPFEPFAQMAVPPDQWVANGVLVCPQTGRSFRLPSTLPPLEGLIEKGRPGVVLSPFSGDWQAVSPDEWKPGGTLTCEVTRRPFLLPHDLEEWIIDGEWVEGRAGRIRSPFRPHAEMDVKLDRAMPGHLLTCPVTNRRFRVPEGGRPSVEDESPTIMGLGAPVPSDEMLTVVAPAFHREPDLDQAGAVEPPPEPAEEQEEVEVASEAPLPGDTIPTPEPFPSPAARSAATPPSPPDASRASTPARTFSEVLPVRPARKLGRLIALAAALVVLGLGGFIFWSTQQPGAVDPGGSTSPPVHRPAQAILEGGLAIQDWTDAAMPNVRLLYKGRPCDDVEVAPKEKEVGFRIQARLPANATGQSALHITAQLPGWESREFTLSADGADFALKQPQSLPRRQVRLPLMIPKEGVDYEFISAKWIRSLSEEPSASPPPGGVLRIPINDNAEERWTPSGVYELTLEGRAGDRSIKPFLWQQEVPNSGKEAPLVLPRAIAGQYFGLMTTDERIGNFFRLTIRSKPLSVKLDEIEFNKQSKFRASDGVPFIGAAVQVAPGDILLETPTILKFDCPIFTTNGKWTFMASAQPFPKLYVTPTIPSSETMERSRQAMIEIFKKDAEEARKEANPAKYRDYADFAKAGFKIDKLRRYATFLATDEIYRQRMAYLKATVDEFKKQYGTDGLWLNMYPAASTLSLNPTNKPEVWDVWMAPE